MNIHTTGGFLKIKLIIAIVVGVLALSGISVYFWGQYKASKSEEAVNTELQEFLNNLRNKAISSPNSSTSPTSSNATGRSDLIKTNAEIINAIKPATVYITAGSELGSGVIISSNGEILTSAHVVKGVSRAQVRLGDGRRLSTRVVGRDEEIDIALLQVDWGDVDNSDNSFLEGDLPTVPLGDSDDVLQGDRVFILGYPFGLETDVSFKEGTISRKLEENGRKYLETTADILPGDSGGPMINERGSVIGINTASFGNRVDGVAVGETLKFATPINVAKEFLPELRSGREVVVETVTEEEPLAPLGQAKREYEAYLVVQKEVNKKINEAIEHHEAGYRYILNEAYTSAAKQFQDASDIFFEAITLNAKKIIPRVPFRDLFEESKQKVEDEIKKRIESSQAMREFSALLKIDPNANYTKQFELLDKDQSLITEADVLLEETKQLQINIQQQAENYFEETL